jgi:predicted dehydrogenase
MLHASVSGGARLMAAHCFRFSPNQALLKNIISDGLLGDVREISAGIGGPYRRASRREEFRTQRTLSGGGAVIDLGIHLIDLALWICGNEPAHVTCDLVVPEESEVESEAEIELTFPNGTRADLFASFSHVPDDTVIVRGTAGWATAPLYTPTELRLFSRRARVCERDGVQRMLLADESMFKLQIQHFRAGIESGTDFSITPDEMLAGIGCVERCYGTVVAV